jgi:hypothetical protein
LKAGFAASVLLLAFVATVPEGLAHTQGPFSAYTPIAPTIDGTITYGNEWSNAYLVSFDLGGGYIGTLYIMNDMTNIYMGLEITDAALHANDLFIVVFDSDHDAVGREDGDDNMVLQGNDGVQDNFYTGGSLSGDTVAGGTVDVVGNAGSAGGVNFFELSHPFNSADDAHDLNIGFGSTVGFMFQYNDADTATLKQWPSALPATEADLTISSPPTRPQLSGRAHGPVAIDGVIGTDEWATAAQSAFSISIYSVTLYVMNDATNLYVGARVSDGALTGTDRLTLQFDNNNDGLGRGPGDDQITVFGDGTFQDVFYATTGPGLSGLTANSDSGSGGTTDGLGAASGAGGFAYFEMVHPLNSADDAHDFSLFVGQHVGFFVVYQDGEGAASGYNRYWPSFQPSAMAEYTVADKITPAITLAFAPGTVDLNVPPGTGTVTATLRDASGHPIPGKTVTLSYATSLVGPWTAFGAGATNSMGEFAATFIPPGIGTYFFQGEVSSDDNLNSGSGTSAPNAMIVIPEFSGNLTILSIVVLTIAVSLTARRRHRR